MRRIEKAFRFGVLGVVLMLVGCDTDTTDPSGLPSGLPIVRLKKTSVDWNYVAPFPPFPRYTDKVEIRYRLEVEQPLPYDLEVGVAFSGASFKEKGWTGIIDDGIRHTMERGTQVLGKRRTFTYDGSGTPFRKFTRSATAVQGDAAKVVTADLTIKTVTISIAPWDGEGSGAFNVGSPHTFTVSR